MKDAPAWSAQPLKVFVSQEATFSLAADLQNVRLLI